jgi:hypothetical protein
VRKKALAKPHAALALGKPGKPPAGRTHWCRAAVVPVRRLKNEGRRGKECVPTLAVLLRSELLVPALVPFWASDQLRPQG